MENGHDIAVGIALGEGRTPLTLKGTLDVARSADANVSIGLNLTYFNISLINLNLSIAESAIRDYVPTFDFADNVFYDASVIGGTADNFTITGEQSFAYVFYQLAPVLSNNFNFDMMPMLEKWISLGNVSDSVTFSDGNFATSHYVNGTANLRIRSAGRPRFPCIQRGQLPRYAN